MLSLIARPTSNRVKSEKKKKRKEKKKEGVSVRMSEFIFNGLDIQ